MKNYAGPGEALGAVLTDGYLAVRRISRMRFSRFLFPPTAKHLSRFVPIIKPIIDADPNDIGSEAIVRRVERHTGKC